MNEFHYITDSDGNVWDGHSCTYMTPEEYTLNYRGFNIVYPDAGELATVYTHSVTELFIKFRAIYGTTEDIRMQNNYASEVYIDQLKRILSGVETNKDAALAKVKDKLQKEENRLKRKQARISRGA